MALTERDVAVVTNAHIIADTAELDRPTWLKYRRQGLGGSDAAATLGLSKWMAPYDLWLDKTGRQVDDDNDGASLAARTGHALEAHVIAETERHLPHVHIDRAPFMLKHPEHPCLLADLDGLAADETRRTRGIFEAKTADGWIANQWADGVPAYYETQVLHYLAVTGLQWALVAVLIGFGRLETYYVERDDEIVDALVAHETAWWERHVLEGEPPAVDGSKATTEALKLIEARAGATTTLAEVQTAPDLFASLAELRQAQDRIDEQDRLLRNQLRAAMGEHTELVDDQGRTWATWRQGRPKQVVDWPSLAADAANRLAIPLEDFVAEHTTTKPGARTLRTTPGEKLATSQENDL